MLPSPYSCRLGPREYYFSRPQRVHCCYGPVTRNLPTGDLVDRLRRFCFHLLRYPNYGALTSTPAGLSPAEHASLTWTHNRTCGFPASGFPTGFTTGSRHDAFPSQMSQSRHTKIAEHRFHAERPDASRRHLMAPDKKVTHAVIQMGLDRAVRDVVGSRTEVAAPSPQRAVQCAAHLSPWSLVARHQDRTQFVLQTSHALVRRTGSDEPPALLPVAMRAKAVTQKVEPVRPRVAQPGLGPVKGQPETCHHTVRPRQGLGRVTAAENDEVVRIIDNMCVPGFASAGLAPVFQEAVHVDVRDQRADDAALRHATSVGLATLHAPLPIPIGRFDRRHEPLFDQRQHVAIDEAASDREHQLMMRNGIEILAQIGIDHVGVALPKQDQHRLDRIARATFRPIAERARVQIRFEDRLQHQFRGGLYNPVPYRWDTERSFAAAGLRDHHPPHWLAPIRLRTQLLAQSGQPVLQARRLDLFERDPVHTWRAFVGAGQIVCVGKDVCSPDLVVQDVEPETRLGLRLFVEFPLQSPDAVRCFQAHRQSPHLIRFENAPEVRVLPSTGITRLQRYHDPVRLPRGPMPLRIVEVAILARHGSPPLTRSPVSTCCSPYPDGPVRVRLPAASPDHTAFPELRAGRRP